MTLPDGPQHLPVLQLVNWIRRPTQFLDACHARFGDVFTVRLATFPPLVVLADPEAIKQVFSAGPDEMHAGAANVVLRPFLGHHSLLMLDGAEHLRHRRLLLPPFHGERMHAYGAQMLALSDREIDRWPLHTPFAIHAPMQEITLQVILRTVFGLQDAARLARASTLLRSGLEIASWAPLLLPALQVDLGRFSPWGRYLRIARQADALLFAEIHQRRAFGRSDRDDVLSLLLQARDEQGQPMSDQELRDELLTLLVAGHETTATALAWGFQRLLEHPRILLRLTGEIAAAAPAGVLLPERLAKLEFLDATVREILRLQPVVPMVGRVLQQPTRIAGYDLPAGTVVAPSIYLAQRRAQVFPEPARFDPERFLRAKPTPYEWFPFGGGIRRCIGMAFALYEMKMVLAAVLSRTSLRLAPGPSARIVRRAITLAPSGGVRVIVDAKRPRVRAGADSAAA
jgi:cytochrome P450